MVLLAGIGDLINFGVVQSLRVLASRRLAAELCLVPFFNWYV